LKNKSKKATPEEITLCTDCKSPAIINNGKTWQASAKTNSMLQRLRQTIQKTGSGFRRVIQE